MEQHYEKNIKSNSNISKTIIKYWGHHYKHLMLLDMTYHIRTVDMLSIQEFTIKNYYLKYQLSYWVSCIFAMMAVTLVANILIV